MKELVKTGDKPIEKNVRDVIESAEMQRAQAEVQAAFAIACKMPRDETKARLGLENSIKRLAFAEKAYYSYPRGNTEIFGPSINLAREFAKHWRNILHGDRIVHDTNEQRTIEGYAWDLETNTCVRAQESFKKLIQRRDKKTKVTRWIEPNERDLRELTRRHVALLKRNCIFELAPKDLIDDMLNKAREITKAGISQKDIKQRRVETVKVFEMLGVYEDKLEAYCKVNFGHQIDKITPDEIAELGGIWNAIKEGNASIEEYFGAATPIKPDPGHEPGEIKMGDLPGPPIETPPPPPPVPPAQPSLSPAEQEAQNELHIHTKEIMVVMTQRHRKEFKPPKDYGVVLNAALAFGNDVRGKITYLSKELEAIGVDVDKEYIEIEAEKAKAEGKK